MALPKRKTSKARRDKRRTHWKLWAPPLLACSHCHELILPHRACPFCGFYQGALVAPPKKKREKKESASE